MKKNLLIVLLTISCCYTALCQTLYTSTVETGSRFSPGNGASGTPIIVFDDVLIPASLVQGTDSVSITKIKLGIRRIASAPAVTVNIYYTVVDDTSAYNNFILIPPVLLGSVSLPANGATSVTTIVSLGDSVNPLFRVKTDTGYLFSGYQTFFLGMGLASIDPTGSNGWRLTIPGAPASNNDNAMWFYDVDASPTRSAHIFTGTSATFYMEAFGTGFGTVPVTLAEFTARRSGKINQLEWTTQQELNASYFTVERSKDGRNFTGIGRVTAAGNSNIIHHYSFTDINPVKGINYYRLRIVDKDNLFRLSKTRSIRNAGIADIAIYPNPVKEKLNLNINTDEAARGQIEISDISGKIVYSATIKIERGNSLLRVAAGTFAAGTYIVKIRLNDDMVVMKFNKQ